MKINKGWVGIAATAAAALLLLQIGSAQTQDNELKSSRRGVGNVIFIHPDGTGANHWGAGRIYWDGPDAQSAWDLLPAMAVYRGHMSDQLTGTSNGGATTHAFGYKVKGPGSYGKDGGGDQARSILSLSGYPGSILREAANAGHPVGVVNDGDAAEPGTGAFLAETGGRGEDTEIVRQILEGRPGFEQEADPAVVLGGGEAFFLPEGTPLCTTSIRPNCAVHTDPVTNDGPERTDGRNLIEAAITDGWIVIRTRQEFEALQSELAAKPRYAPKVLGLFAANDTFNDVAEEELIAKGLVDASIPASDKRGSLILWGNKPDTLGFNPPTAGEMTEMALTILSRRSREADKPFMLVTEVESTDNFGNNNNAIGSLNAVQRSNQVIGAARTFQGRSPNTLILTAADSDGGGLQLIAPPPLDSATGQVTNVNGNPTGDDTQRVNFPVDGILGRGTQPFQAAPDAFGQALPFAITWTGTPDVSGGIISRAQGLNAELLPSTFAARFDNTDVYRMMYLTLFDKTLPSAVGKQAPSRP